MFSFGGTGFKQNKSLNLLQMVVMKPNMPSFQSSTHKLVIGACAGIATSGGWWGWQVVVVYSKHG